MIRYILWLAPCIRLLFSCVVVSGVSSLLSLVLDHSEQSPAFLNCMRTSSLMMKRVTNHRWDRPLSKNNILRTNLKRLFAICFVAFLFCLISSYDNLGYFVSKRDPLISTSRVISTNETIASCVFVKWPGGWGNTLLLVLHNVLRNTVVQTNGAPVFPCIRGYGEVFSKIFYNLNQCPLEDPVVQCYGTSKNPKKHPPWPEIRAFIKQGRDTVPSLMQSLLQLNATYVDEVFAFAGASFTLEDLKRSSCAVHVRFGDFYFRESPTEAGKKKLKKQRRACKNSKNVSACFDQVVGMVREKCPDPDVPIYVATDLSNFTRYFCAKEQNRTILSSCNEESITSRATHSNDIQLIDKVTYAMNDDALSSFMGLLSDWLALALAQTLGQVAHSTFSETALLEFYA